MSQFHVIIIRLWLTLVHEDNTAHVKCAISGRAWHLLLSWNPPITLRSAYFSFHELQGSEFSRSFQLYPLLVFKIPESRSFLTQWARLARGFFVEPAFAKLASTSHIGLSHLGRTILKKRFDFHTGVYQNCSKTAFFRTRKTSGHEGERRLGHLGGRPPTEAKL